MPQLDLSTYSSQIFWLVICFSILYFVLSSFILPKIKKIIEDRNLVANLDIKKAEEAKERAKILEEELANALIEARNKARKILVEASNEIKREIEIRNDKFEQEMNIELKKLGNDFISIKDEVMSQAKELSDNYLKIVITKIFGAQKFIINSSKY